MSGAVDTSGLGGLVSAATGAIPGPAGVAIKNAIGQLGPGKGLASGFGGGSSEAGSDSGYGAPIVVTDITSRNKSRRRSASGLKQAGSDIKATGAAVNQTLTTDTGQLTSTGTGLTQYFGNLVYDILPRGVAAAMAIIFNTSRAMDDRGLAKTFVKIINHIDLSCGAPRGLRARFNDHDFGRVPRTYHPLGFPARYTGLRGRCWSTCFERAVDKLSA